MSSIPEVLELAPVIPAVAVVEAPAEEAAPAEETPNESVEPKRRAADRKRASIFGSFLGKKEKPREETPAEESTPAEEPSSSSSNKLLGLDWVPRQQIDGASATLRATKKRRRRSRSWAEPSADEKAPLTSILDHVTNAEDVFETKLFSDSGDELTFIRNNIDWENSLVGNNSDDHTSGARDFDGRGKHKEISVSIDEFLARWKTILEGREIPTQYLA